MAKRTQKKGWETPELIVLVRSKPDEMVLTACKADPKGPTGVYGGCHGAPYCIPCGTGGKS